jgi:hypothetical protein
MSTDFDPVPCDIEVAPGGKLDLHGSWFDSWRRLLRLQPRVPHRSKVDGTVNWFWAAHQLATTVWKDELTNQNGSGVSRASAVTGRASPWTNHLSTSTTGTLPLPSDYCRLVRFCRLMSS